MGKSKHLYLQNRDIEIIRIVCELGYINIPLLVEQELFKTYSVAFKRLAFLKKSGFIGAHYRTTNKRASLIFYPIIESYRGILEKESYLRAQKTVHFKPWFNMYGRHEDILRSWALRFRRVFSDAQIDLDFMLYNNKELGGEIPLYMQERLPDMVVDINGLDSIYVEIELTQKTNRRYESKIKDALKREDCLTLYLTDTVAIKHSVARAIEQNILNEETHSPIVPKNVHVYLFSELKEDRVFREKILSLGEQRVAFRLASGLHI